MDDRTLLELAAKAVGYKRIDFNQYEEAHYVSMGYPPVNDWKLWIPLDDDGDALRLAVKLSMEVTIYSVCTDAQAYGKDKVRETGEGYEYDQYSVTRRAIVRAAAEIGKSLP